MDTILKYLFYLVLIFVIYLVIAGFYNGKIDKNSTISEVGEEVSDNAKRIIRNTYNDTKNEADKVENEVSEDKKQ